MVHMTFDYNLSIVRAEERDIGNDLRLLKETVRNTLELGGEK